RCLSDWSSDVCSSDLCSNSVAAVPRPLRRQPPGCNPTPLEKRSKCPPAGAASDRGGARHTTARHGNGVAILQILLTGLLCERRRSEERRVGKEWRCEW